jgi:glycosyltransferase involved in cell wall biosynthesis
MTRTVALVYGHPLELGGVETHLLSLVGQKGAFRFRLVGEARGAFRERLLGAGVEIEEWSPRSAWDRRAALRLSKAMERVDLVHLHSPRAFFLGRLAARLRPRPSVLTVHVDTAAPGGFRNRLYARIERLLGTRFPDRVIYVSHRAFEEAAGSPFGMRGVVIGNAAPEAFPGTRAEARAALGCREDARIVICVARLSPQKDLGTLLASARLLGEGTFWIAGSGPLQGPLEALARELGISERVLFLGARQDVPRLLRAADVFALPSLYEGMSVALLEAMAAGLPCVATSVGDADALLVETGAGLVVPTKSPPALAEALRVVLRSPELRKKMGAAGLARAALFTEKATFEKTSAVYEEVLRIRAAP